MWMGVFGAGLAQGAPLGLEAYVGQVREKNLGYKASQAGHDAAVAQFEKASLMYVPSFFANASYLNESAPRTNAMGGTGTKVAAYSLGVETASSFGFSGKVTIGNDATTMVGTSPTIIPMPEFDQTSLKAEVRQALWKNGFGSGTRAMVEAGEAQAKAQAAGESFKNDMLLAQAEAAYWRLASAREQVRVSRESLERSKRMRDLTARKTEMNLADNSNLLQSQAALKAVELQLQSALDEETNAAREFNRLRNVPSGDVDDALAVPSDVVAKGISLPAKKGVRGDLVVARETSRALEARARLSKDDVTPQLDLFGSATLQGKNPAFGDAFSQTFSTDYPSYLVGLSFKVPLDLGLLRRVARGHDLEADAARRTAEQKEFDDRQSYDSLRSMAEQLLNRLKLVQALEAAQKTKYDNEKSRHEKGRTTIFQLIQFEQDMATAQLSRIVLEGQILQIVSQLKVFNVDGGAL